MKAIIFDTETTGLTLPSVSEVVKQPRIIELGCLLVDCSHYDVIDSYSQLLYPGFQIDKEVSDITHITNDDLRGKPRFPEVVERLDEFFSRGKNFIVAHNAPFDLAVLSYELDACKKADFSWPKDPICTTAEYYPLFGFRPSMLLLYEKILGRELVQEHRALSDVHALLEILKADDFFGKIGAR